MKTKSVLMALIVALISANTAFALPVILSDDNQSFNKNQAPAQLRNITITEDLQFSYIKQGTISITIPDSLKMIFDKDMTTENIIIYGTAVTHEKVDESPEITFGNGDKTLVIPVNADFELGENIVITKIYVEGFNDYALESDNLFMKLNNEDAQYLDNKNIGISTSTIQDVQAPDAPLNLTVNDYQGGVLLTWEDPTDLDLSQVEILRGKNSIVSGIPYMTISNGIQEFVDTDVSEGDTVNYILRATDGKNYSANTEEVSFVVGSTIIEEPDEEPVSDPIDENPAEEPAVEDQFCTLDYTPVCGVDGITYTNTCTAEKEPVEIAHEGECTPEESTAQSEQPEEEPQVEPEVPVEFTDITDHWAKAEIQAMADKSIVKGQSEGIFNPNGNLNRAEGAALLYRILGLPEPTVPAEAPFSDVQTTEWYAGYINELKALKLVNGNPDGTFAPESSINRAEFLTLAMNLYTYLASDDEKIAIEELQAGEQTKAYIDLKNDWYTSIITAATAKEFIKGSTCGNFKCVNAESTITRAEAVTILYRMFGDYLAINTNADESSETVSPDETDEADSATPSADTDIDPTSVGDPTGY